MKVLARPVGTGKTKELLQIASNEKALVLTDKKNELLEKANAYNITVQIIDWDDLMNIDYKEYNKVYIHKMDDLVKHWLWEDYGIELQGYSIRTEE